MSSEGGNLPKTNLGLNPSIKLPPGVMPQPVAPTQDMMDRAFRDKLILEVTLKLLDGPGVDPPTNVVDYVGDLTKGIMGLRKELDNGNVH